jgi:cytochrome c553
MKARKIVLWIVVVLVLAAVAIQFVPVQRTNPPATSPLVADAAVLEVLQQSCYDCHSNETKWPWYAYVAPVSWMVTRDVNGARHHINFSEWGDMTAAKRSHAPDNMLDEINEGGMPLPNYLKMHPDAKLSAEDIATLKQWAAQMDAANGMAEGGGAESDAQGGDADGDEGGGSSADHDNDGD